MICPFCSLLCNSSQSTESCSLRLGFLEHIRTDTESLDTKEDSVGKAKQWINCAETIMIAGRIVSVDSSRAALTFANHINGHIDCSDREVTMDMAAAISKTGTCSVSIAEVRDLSDVIIVLGDDCLPDRFPNIASCLAKRDRSPVVVLLGEHTSKSMNLWKQCFAETWAIACETNRIPEALHSFFSLQIASPIPDITGQVNTESLFQQLRTANYISIVWAPNSLGPYSVEPRGRSAWIERLQEHQVEWNEKRRIGSLALSGQDSVFQQVCLWTTGFPGRVSFLNGAIDFDPSVFAVSRWIEDNKNRDDALLIEFDETANSTNDWLDLQLDGFRGRRILAAPLSRSKTRDNPALIYLPTQIAGYDRPADLLRADQTVLARVPETHSTRSAATRSLSDWMEALSR